MTSVRSVGQEEFVVHSQSFKLPEQDTHFKDALRLSDNKYQHSHRFNSLSIVTNFGVALDVGAHIGTWTIDLEEMFDRVICFEPIKEHIECLKSNINFPDKVEIIECALGEEIDKEIFLEYAQEGNSGTAGVVSEGEGEYSATSTTLDSFNYPKIDYIKVDVEGYELPFLRGAKETILRTKPVINIEIKDTCARFGDTPLDIIDYIRDELGMVYVNKVVADYVFKYPEGDTTFA